MKRFILSIIFLFLFAIPAISQNIKVAGIASKGGKIVRTSAQVQHTLMETYPTSTVTVYQTGTLTLASIFSDEVGTPKSNPFTANTDASWYFYIAQGRYDIKFSGTGILVPFTLSDVFVEATGGGGGGDVTSVFGRQGDVIYQTGDVPFTGLNFTGSNFNSIETRSASDLNAGTLPDARFPVTLPAISGANLTNLNATNITTGTLDDARLSSNIPRKNTANTFTQDNIFTTNVGINTLTPRRRLDVLDGSNAQIRLTAVDNSVYTDLFVDSGGSLNVLPTGNVAFNSTGKQVNPLNNFDQNLGQINKKWLSLHAAELFVETLVAQNTIATIGGRIIVAPSNILIADLAPATTTIQVKYNNLNNGDRLYMEGNSSVEFLAVTSGASVISGGFSYSVTRNLDGTGANQWFAGDAMVNTGVAGNGFIDLYSVRGVKSSTQFGPTIVGNVRNSSTFNDWTENWAIGNLNGIFGYGADTYGVAFGKYSSGSTHITIDATNGYRIFNGLSTLIGQWDNAGNITIGQVAINESNILISSDFLKLRSNTLDRIVLDAGGVLIGEASSSNVQLTTTQVNLRNGSTERVSLSSAGVLTIKDSGGNAVLTFDASLGAEITKKLTMPGVNSAISIGATPPTSASAGDGIWIDRTGLYALDANVLQIKIDAANGQLIGGAGAVTLDSGGIKIASGSGGENSIRWFNSSDNILRVYADIGAPNNTVTEVTSTAKGGQTSAVTQLTLRAANADGLQSAIYFNSFGSTHATHPRENNIQLDVNRFAASTQAGVLISDTGPDFGGIPASTILELRSTTGAFIPPKMTTTQRDALTAIDGMHIYNITLGTAQYYKAGVWTSY